MFKVSKGLTPNYVLNIFEKFKTPRIRTVRVRRIFQVPIYSSSKFLSSPAINLMKVWNNLDPIIRSLPSLSQLKSKVCHKFCRDLVVSTTMIKNLNRKEELCLNRLRVDLYLKSQLYSHNFANINPNCTYCNTGLTTKHFLLSCRHPNRTPIFEILLNSLDNIQALAYFNTLSMSNKCKFLLIGDKTYSIQTNIKISCITARYITSVNS